MNITPNKLLYIISAMLTGIAFMVSCSKNPETQRTKPSDFNAVKQMKSTRVTKKADDIVPDGKHVLNAFRDGQYVSLDWHMEVAGHKLRQIDVLRNSTGRGLTRKVAELTPDSTSYRDCLPNDNAHWYWLALITTDNKIQEIGPVRVSPDKAGAAHYVNPEVKYKVTVTRTDDLATLNWDFPEAEYKKIRVVRNTRPVEEPFKSKSSPVLATLSWKSQYADALPDPNSEYWYSFQITTKTGEIIYKNSIKAEYARR